METPRWRKWFSSSSPPTRIPQDEERGMLKQLLGHWKAHRKKPTLLPEEAEVHFEDSSTVNPLFEDNESAVTSEALGELAAVIDAITSDLDKGLDDEPEDNSDGNLIDIDPGDSSANNFEPSIENTKETERNETTDSDKSIIANDIKVVEGEVISTQFPVNSTISEVKEGPLQDELSTNDLKHILSPTVSETIQKQEQPSNNTGEPVENSEISEETKNSVIKKNTTGKGKFKKNKKSNTEQEMILKIQDSPSVTSGGRVGKDVNKNVNPISSTLNGESESEKANKPRGIADLIKKFQGSNADSKSDSQKESSEVKGDESKIKISETISNAKNKSIVINGTEKESISKIFNIPPPPPIEPEKLSSQRNEKPKPNESFLASIANGSKNLKTSSKVKTRTDSSLERNKTVSSNISQSENLTKENQTSSEIKNETTIINEPTKSVSTISFTLPKEPVVVETNSSVSKESTKTIVNKPTLPAVEDKIIEEKVVKKPFENSKVPILKENIASTSQKSPIIANSSLKQEIQKRFPSYRKQTEIIAKSSPASEKKDDKESANKVESVDANSSLKETKVAKSHSEDSGITRGDQISSEATQDNQPEEPANENTEINKTRSMRRSKRDRKIQREHHRGKNCKHCRRQHDGTRPLKKGKCDEYYDILTGARRLHRNKHSESWASDLSWEEKELIRRLRCRRAANRSNNSSMRSKHSRHPNPENSHFQRAQALRRSLSDDSTFYGSSMCSCDECWLSLVKDYAYGRASLRAAPNQALCTCRMIRPEFLNRKVKFRSETIPEVSTIERSLTTPSIPEESDKKEDTVSDASNSKLSSSDRDKASKSGKSNGKTTANSESLKDKYLLMTPWELEEWDLARKKYLLMKRRKRARNMGLIALAMVIFIGLVVTVVMIYLRRKTL